MVKALIDQGVNINFKNEGGRTPLEFAISNGRINSARLLRIMEVKSVLFSLLL